MQDPPATPVPTETEFRALLRRIEDLETQVSALAQKLSGATPQENARKIRILSKIIEGLAQTIRRIARQLDSSRRPPERPTPT